MLDLDAALAKILEGLAPLPPERAALVDARDRVLADDVVAPRDLPPEASSAMDGYAVRAEDTKGAPVTLKLEGHIAAGAHAERALEKGEAFRIFTGAPLPGGADAVVMQEDTRATDGEVEIGIEVPEGHHVRPRGDDVRSGDVVVPSGTVLGPAELGAAAGQGRTLLFVHRRPRVAILSSGDELVEPDGDPTNGRIISSNGDAIAAGCEEAGAVPILLGTAPDTEADIDALFDAAAGADVIVSSGGVSVGEHDYVKSVLEARGMETVFWRVAIKPGKPLLFGRLGGRPVFGLPGNPVSALVTFEVFVRPALRRLAGHAEVRRPVLDVRLAADAPAAPGRTNLVWVRLAREDGGWVATPHAGQRSHRASAPVGAHALVPVAPDTPIPAGETAAAWVVRLPGI